MWKKWNECTWYNMNTGHILKQEQTLKHSFDATKPDRWVESVFIESEKRPYLIWKDFETKAEALAFIEEFIK